MINKTIKLILISSITFAVAPIYAIGEEVDSSGEETINTPFPCQPIPTCLTDNEIAGSNFSIWSSLEQIGSAN